MAESSPMSIKPGLVELPVLHDSLPDQSGFVVVSHEVEIHQYPSSYAGPEMGPGKGALSLLAVVRQGFGRLNNCSASESGRQGPVYPSRRFQVEFVTSQQEGQDFLYRSTPFSLRVLTTIHRAPSLAMVIIIVIINGLLSEELKIYKSEKHRNIKIRVIM